ncbi:Phospholipid ABC transporter ATP-binding protein MlaF [hydrothermal vent metagenome]|uniref:Phospholipid ABC transporter ATP-binding protein MlaF n=1 Tax=hydrothermal vent metagenome TaxID=652676 RepID=A0A3B0RIV5_9ZZZZ
MNQADKISISGLHKAFGSKQVLQGVDLGVAPGKSLVVIGGSGTGKSVLLKSILGLMTPDRGSIKIDGEETIGQSSRAAAKTAAKFGMLFQGGALFDSMSVWQNIAFRLTHADHTPREQAKQMALAAMKRVNLSASNADLSPAELSGGMQKRVGLARAIVTKPQILFFDEPTTGLDPITADVINRLIREQVTNLGATAISITHDMQSARHIADEIAMIWQGKIIWRGPASDIDHSGNPYVEQFVKGSAEGPIDVMGGE